MTFEGRLSQANRITLDDNGKQVVTPDPRWHVVDDKYPQYQERGRRIFGSGATQDEAVTAAFEMLCREATHWAPGKHIVRLVVQGLVLREREVEVSA